MTEAPAGAALGSGARPRLVDRYRQFLAITDATPRLTLGEGFTPLVAAPRLGARIGVPNLHLKLEGLNPTMTSRMLGVLDTMGLIERTPDPSDLRSASITATPAGRRSDERIKALRAGWSRPRWTDSPPPSRGRC